MIIPDDMYQHLESMIGESKRKPHIAQAPGRIEVLGNHTDYNSGLVLSATIDRYVWALGVPDERVRIYAMDFDQMEEFELTDLNPTSTHPWVKYAMGIYWAFLRRRHKVRGVTAVIHGDVPIEGGLSSSAAFEVALANLVLSTSGLKINPKAAAMISFEAERLYCGISCGVMDQFTSQLGKPDSLLHINCRNLMTSNIRMDTNASFVVVDSKIVRPAGNALNRRRHECLEALGVLQEAGWNINNLSDIGIDYLTKAEDLLDETLMNRVTHIVRENDRVKRGIEAIENRNLIAFGKIMNESHQSSRNLYEVSHSNLDLLVDMSLKQNGVFGSRLSGAGLGGAIIALVANDRIESYSHAVGNQYERETGLVPEILPVSIPGGVQVSNC